MERSRYRPKGILAVVIYAGLSATITLLAGVSFLFAPAVPIVVVAFQFFASFIAYAACFGLWLIKRWGHLLAIFVFLMGIVTNLVFSGEREVTSTYQLAHLIGYVIDIAAIFYLLSASVRSAYWLENEGKA